MNVNQRQDLVQRQGNNKVKLECTPTSKEMKSRMLKVQDVQCGHLPLVPVRLDSAVRPFVPGQLVRTGEPPAAVFPVADERFLASVTPHVGLQVTRLCVHLAAAGERARENFVLVFDVRFGWGIFPGNFSVRISVTRLGYF